MTRWSSWRAARTARIETRKLADRANSSPVPARPTLADDEILIAIECEALPGYGGSFEKVGHRRSLVISTVCLAALVKLDASGRKFEDVRLASAASARCRIACAMSSNFLLSGPLTMSRLEQAAEMPVDLVRSRTRQDYRRDVVRGFMLRGLFNAAQRAGADPDVLTPEMEAACA